ncbi:hypothetical protein HER21_41830, partial [Pseudomonas sp. BGM005]|nr:hypothetical protein [Pseudomonas sp. BG5]
VASGPDEAASRRRFVEDVFPRAVAAGREVIDGPDGARRSVSRLIFDESFSEAYAYRVALVPDLGHADLDAADGRLLTSLDAGDPERFLRALWLER